jgi:hypothetical protein
MVETHAVKTHAEIKQYIEKHGKYPPLDILNKVEVTIGCTTYVTEFENGKRTDYTTSSLDELRKEAQKIMDELSSK